MKLEEWRAKARKPVVVYRPRAPRPARACPTVTMSPFEAVKLFGKQIQKMADAAFMAAKATGDLIRKVAEDIATACAHMLALAGELAASAERSDGREKWAIHGQLVPPSDGFCAANRPHGKREFRRRRAKDPIP